MASPSLIPAGDYRTSYAADTTIFPTTTSRNAAMVGIVLICFAPLVLSGYSLSILIQIGIFSIAALGATMQEPTFYQQDGAAIVALNNELAALQVELDAAYARWQELDAG